MEGGFPPGMVLLEKYRVEGELGRGGMGVVLRVTHLHLGEELAIKVVLPDAGGGSEVHARFLREAQSAVRLRGEHVARVGDVGVLPGGAPYMVMEYLRGGDLAGELARRGPLPPGEVVDYVLQACEALAEAHALGIVHRDIKPSNLYLTRRPDGSPLVKVLDFGISKAPIGGPGVLTRTDTVMGTPGYMSPEQMKASKDVDARSDIWALGIVLYECVNGRRPFDAETFSATVLRAATEPAPPMDPRLPRGLQAVILRCLEKDRAARFPSIAALAAALAPFARDARSAGIVVDRTTAMLQGPGASVAQGTRFDQPPHATTLSGSAGMMRARSTRRYAIGGAAALVTTIVAIAVIARTTSHASQDNRSGGSGTAAASGLDGRVAIDAGEGTTGASPIPDARGEVAVRVAIDASVAPTEPDTAAVPSAAADGAFADARAKAVQCAELEVNQKWQQLRTCASELAGLGKRDRSVMSRADGLRQKAIKETAHELAAGKLKDAITEGDLREAHKQLKSIGSDSVYFTAASEAFHGAETSAIDDYRRKAQALLAKHDCSGIKRLQAQATATSTAAVTGAVAAIAAQCADRRSSSSTVTAVANPSDQKTAAPASSCEALDVDDALVQAEKQYAAGFAKAALQVMTKILTCKQEARLYRLAATYACAARERDAAKQLYAKVPAQFQPGIVQRCQIAGLDLGNSTHDPRNRQLAQPQVPPQAAPEAMDACDTMDVDALLAQATAQHKAGSSTMALATMTKVLTCTQTIRMIQMAAVFACAARNGPAAQHYYSMLSASLQPAIRDLCAQDSIKLSP